MPTYSVTLDKQNTLLVPATQPEPYRVLLTVTSVVGLLDKGVFVYQINTVTKEPVYSHVASPSDYQAYAFEDVGGNEFVRKASVQRDFATATLADEFVAALESAIDNLVDNFAIIATLIPGGTTIISSDD